MHKDNLAFSEGNVKSKPVIKNKKCPSPIAGTSLDKSQSNVHKFENNNASESYNNNFVATVKKEGPSRCECFNSKYREDLQKKLSVSKQEQGTLDKIFIWDSDTIILKDRKCPVVTFMGPMSPIAMRQRPLTTQLRVAGLPTEVCD